MVAITHKWEWRHNSKTEYEKELGSEARAGSNERVFQLSGELH